MIRILVYLALLFAVAAGFAWLADRPGEIALVWQGYEIRTSLMVAAIQTSILLGAAFRGLGVLASSVVQESSTAAGIASGLWLLLGALYDMALLAALVARGGHAVPGALMDLALLANPTDAYRLLTLGEGSSAMLSGMGGVYDNSHLTPTLLVAALLAWCLLPLALAMTVFSRRNL